MWLLELLALIIQEMMWPPVEIRRLRRGYKLGHISFIGDMTRMGEVA